MSKALDYPFTVRPLGKEDGGGYLCEFPDLPGVMGDGGTVEEAIGDARKALKAALATLRQLGRTPPEPTQASGQWRMRAPRSLHQRLAARAKAEGVSLNTLAVSLLAEGLGRRDKDAA
ncbi:MAG: toxin-antitoxin system HicB family antitoxin [Rhizomicrobium sp.]|nr:toxin-antitoxin system HicB family antitoxin [Rhizomicrobium sp.]